MKFLRWATPLLVLASLVATASAQHPAAKPAATKPAAARPRTATPARTRSAGARPERLDGIAAVVNDEVVLESDVEEQLMLFLGQSQAAPDSTEIDTLRRQVLNQLIDEKLIVNEAKRQGLSVADGEVEGQLNQQIAEVKQRLGGEQQFQDRLRQEGMTEAKLREKYRADLSRQMLAQRLVRKALPEKKVSQTEAETYFKANPDKFPKMAPEVKLSVIQIPASADSATEAKGKAKALDLRRRITAGEKFAKLAAEASEDPNTARSGGDLGFFAKGAMEPALEDAAFSLKPGEVSMPVRSPYGWHLMEVMERDTLKSMAGMDTLDAQGKPIPEVHLRHILVAVPVSDADGERARKLAQRVHGEAVKGTDFATLARRYSKYVGPHSEDGDIGYVNLSTLSPNIRAGLDTLEVGQVSDVLQNKIGFNLFKITERRAARPYTLEEIKDELPGAVAQIQFRERYDTWMKALRTKAIIRISGS